MRNLIGILALAASALCTAPAAAALLGPTAYSTSANSPFFPFAGFTYFHLETFDDHALNTPGVTANNGATAANSGFSGSVIDQVGSSGGCPAGGLSVACDTWFSGNGATGVRFTFNAGALGQLPNAAGLVWTDGAGTITFEAFDENGVSLGTVGGNHADGSFNGTTDEDRFYGVTTSGGISSLLISNTGGGIEIDHLQYGLRAAATPGTPGLPEPGTLFLLSIALGGIAALRRRG